MRTKNWRRSWEHQLPQEGAGQGLDKAMAWPLEQSLHKDSCSSSGGDWANAHYYGDQVGDMGIHGLMTQSALFTLNNTMGLI